ncbi:DeoR family transcriptional regulator [Spirochaetia bacterium]|nr:DeoR family transcriptional regulator [Spirochaetia bacterium]
MKKLPYLRRKEILEILKRNDYVDLRHLSEQFDVSYMTIHRDIEELQRKGEVLRVYGGAKMNAQTDRTNGKLVYPSQISTDLTIEERFNESRDFKQMIAQKAAAFVRDGDIIGMDPSTTTLHMCSYISHMNITVFTTSLMVALQLSSSPTVKVILAGGQLRKPSMSLLSLSPQTANPGVHMKMSFLSSKAISFKEGLTDLTVEEPESKRLLAQHSEKVFVLVDHTKIGKVANYHALNYQEMTSIITDSATEMSQEQMDCLREYREKGVNVIFADSEGIDNFQKWSEHSA